ncbi:TetR/AcrR family transcriptional regulator [Bacillus sp. REN16]|uniref:TetR/AcrR family transcriptional regulator n=1 Tax=Bacillus sp. REN16 TaxID=2887296 RepID=UPI001E5C8D8C|nr:TetR/AcrR family transcriptional regulator [Bacillus sp. REN16]MCC3358115.1 TetR/AcrR family transcriptional regulator [Bacillus sp. REN16]
MVKKQLIMEKALELFAKQGFEATSVQQITDQCGISKGAFYLSFKSKDELIIALIDQFIEQIFTDIDQVVRSKNSKKNLLYEYYYVSFQSFKQHTDFANILMKEYTQSLNEKLILKMHYFDKLINSDILLLIDRIYGEKVKHTKYDLLYCIKGFTRMYSELFLFQGIPFDLDMNLLCRSLVEKTNLLAQGMTLSFLNQEHMDFSGFQLQSEVTKEQIVSLIEEKVKEMDDSIVKESLLLLQEQTLDQTYSLAIIKGLLENIRNHPHCKWIAYLLGRYFDQKNTAEH